MGLLSVCLNVECGCCSAGLSAGSWRPSSDLIPRLQGRSQAKQSANTEIINGLPEFEAGDRFRMNIVSCAMLAAFYLQMAPKPSLEKMTAYYNAAMMTGAMRLFCRMSAKRRFTAADVEGMRKTALLRAADRNPYSWNMELLTYPDGSGNQILISADGNNSHFASMRSDSKMRIIRPLCALFTCLSVRACQIPAFGYNVA